MAQVDMSLRSLLVTGKLHHKILFLPSVSGTEEK